jgi:hypothetical protein
MKTVGLSIRKSRGYTIGKRSLKSYIARINGSDEQYGFSREFMERTGVEGDPHRGTWIEHFDLEPGLYEVQEYGVRRYAVVYCNGNEVEYSFCEITRAQQIVQLLDEGMQFDVTREATRRAA